MDVTTSAVLNDIATTLLVVLSPASAKSACQQDASGATVARVNQLVLQFIPHAGLGNQLSEYSAAYSIAKTTVRELRCMWKPSRKREFGLGHFGIKPDPFDEMPLLMNRPGQGNRKHFLDAVRLVSASQEPRCAIRAAFQTEDCFRDHAAEIKRLFAVAPFPLRLSAGMTPVGVQVRRGDYLTHPRLNVTTPQYFRNAMDWMRARIARPHFFIVSDDPAWCRRQFERMLDVTVMPPQEPIDGLRTLASCEACIISNSTFGWWGAWLGEKGPVVVPERWYQGTGGYGDWNPVPDRWHKVSVGEAAPPAAQPLVARQVVELDAPKVPRAIVYPWHADQAKWHELRYSLRSIEKHFADKKCPIYILATRKPDWLIENPRVKYIGAWSYPAALSKGLQLAETVMWMNDDIVLLKDVGWDEVSVPRFVQTIDPVAALAASEQENLWKEGCRKVLAQLAAEGVTDLKLYSTHTPYVFERWRSLEVFRRFGVFHKIPFETAYFNLFPDGATDIGGDRVHEMPLDGATYLNHTDRHLTPELKDELRRRFPDFAPWELEVAFNG